MKKLLLMLIIGISLSSCKIVSYSRDENMAKKLVHIAEAYHADRRKAKWSTSDTQEGLLAVGKPNRVRTSVLGLLSMLVGLEEAKELLKPIPIINEEEKNLGKK